MDDADLAALDLAVMVAKILGAKGQLDYDRVFTEILDKSSRNLARLEDAPNNPYRSVTSPDDLIVDPLAGTGTFGLPALNLGRKWIGIEIQEKMVKIAKTRLQAKLKELLK